MLAGAEILGKREPALAEIRLHRRTDDAGQVADIAGRQIIAFHEPLDITHAAARSKAHARRDRHLRVEIQPFLRPSGKKMKMTPHRPQEPLRGGESPRLAFAQHTLVDNIDDAVGAVGKLGDPEQGVQVAKPAFALLDVRFDHVAGGAVFLMAGVPLGKLDLDEITRLQPRHLAPE